MQNNDLNKLLKEFRTSTGLTQKEFAEKCGFSSAKYVTNLETVIRPIGMKTIDITMRAFNKKMIFKIE